MKQTLEILVLGYMCGLVLMPGSNQQFQFWFLSLVPIMIEMVGLHSILTFWVYGYYYPVDFRRDDVAPQHLFILGLTAWLITVGPRPNLLKDALWLSRQTIHKPLVFTKWLIKRLGPAIKRAIRRVEEITNEM